MENLASLNNIIKQDNYIIPEYSRAEPDIAYKFLNVNKYSYYYHTI